MGPQLALLALRLPTFARKILFAKAHNGIFVLNNGWINGGIMQNKPVVKASEILQQAYNNLCCYDPRSPEYADLTMFDDPEDGPRQPRTDCYCDNCFRGNDRLALIIIEQEEQKEKVLKSLIELVDKIKYFPGELSKDNYAVKRAEKLIDNIGG